MRTGAVEERAGVRTGRAAAAAEGVTATPINIHAIYRKIISTIYKMPSIHGQYFVFDKGTIRAIQMVPIMRECRKLQWAVLGTAMAAAMGGFGGAVGVNSRVCVGFIFSHCQLVRV